MAGVELVGVVDTKPGRAAGDRGEVRDHGVHRCVRRWSDRVDAVTIAAPTVVARRRRAAVRRGRRAGAGREAARRVSRRGRRAGRGRRGARHACWRPATPSASTRRSRPRCRSCPSPRFIEVHRLGTFPERSLDIDVIFDLMIHDLDLLLAVGRVRGRVGRGGRRERAHAARRHRQRAAALRVGCIANLTASRISRDRVRKARFFQHDSYVSIDYAAQEVEVYRLVPQNGRPAGHPGRPHRRRQRGAAAARAADFVDADPRTRRGQPARHRHATGRDALALATRDRRA